MASSVSRRISSGEVVIASGRMVAGAAEGRGGVSGAGPGVGATFHGRFTGTTRILRALVGKVCVRDSEQGRAPDHHTGTFKRGLHEQVDQQGGECGFVAGTGSGSAPRRDPRRRRGSGDRRGRVRCAAAAWAKPEQKHGRKGEGGGVGLIELEETPLERPLGDERALQERRRHDAARLIEKVRGVERTRRSTRWSSACAARAWA